METRRKAFALRQLWRTDRPGEGRGILDVELAGKVVIMRILKIEK